MSARLDPPEPEVDPWASGPAEGTEGRIGRDFGGAKGQLLPPDRPRGQAPLHDRLEEAAEDPQPVALPDAREAGMVGERLGRVVAERGSAG